MSNVLAETKNGKMIVNDKDKYVGASLIKYGEFSESEGDLFRSLIKPGMTVIDVGANYGAHTLLFSRLVGNTGHVYAFEPQVQVYNCLCGSLALNNLTNVTAVCAAVGVSGEKVKYVELDYNQENNFGGYSFEQIEDGQEMDVVPLNVPCHFIKIDVEGMELAVVKGAAEMIREYQPVMYVEADRPKKNEELFKFIRSLGYEIYWHSAPFFNTNNINQDKENLFEGIASINVLCVPKDITIHGLTVAHASDWHEHFKSSNGDA